MVLLYSEKLNSMPLPSTFPYLSAETENELPYVTPTKANIKPQTNKQIRIKFMIMPPL